MVKRLQTPPCTFPSRQKFIFRNYEKKTFGRLAPKVFRSAALLNLHAEPHLCRALTWMFNCRNAISMMVMCARVVARCSRTQEEPLQMQLSSSKGWFSTNIINVANRAPEVCQSLYLPAVFNYGGGKKMRKDFTSPLNGSLNQIASFYLQIFR